MIQNTRHYTQNHLNIKVYASIFIYMTNRSTTPNVVRGKHAKVQGVVPKIKTYQHRSLLTVFISINSNRPTTVTSHIQPEGKHVGH